MIRQTKILIFLVFSLFLFHLAEQNIPFFKDSHQYAMQFPVNNQGDFDNQICDDTESTIEDAMFESTFHAFKNIRFIKITLPRNNRLLVSVISEHWEPPK